MDWYPQAIKSSGNSSGTFDKTYPKRGVIHTTEGSSAAGAIQAYRNNNSWPHFTVAANGEIYQHVSISQAARSMENRSGGVETNRAGAIQIEVVGFASRPNWPGSQILAMRSLMRWIEAEMGVQPTGPRFGSGEQYGLKNPLEFTNEQWRAFKGWCGHQHVPENSHWDPGAIDLSLLLPVIPTPPVQEIHNNVNIQLVDLTIPVGADGNGWTVAQHSTNKIVGFLPPGLRPGADGRYETGEVGFAQEDNHTIVSITGWAPGTNAIVRLRVEV